MRTQTHCSPPIVRALLFLTVTVSLAGCSATSGYTANRMGTAYYRGGNYTAALYEFRRAAIDSPRNADYAYNLAAAMKKSGDIIGSEQTYRNALAVNPTHQPAYHGLAVLLNEQNRTAESSQLIESWAESQPLTPAAHIELAWLKSERGDFATAERSLQQALSMRPNHPVALAQLGQLYEQTGQNDRAAAMYQQSLRSNWYQPRVQSRLAAIRRPASTGALPVFAQNPTSPVTAQARPLPGYAQYQPYQPLPMFADNSLSPSAVSSNSAPPQVAVKYGMTGGIGGAPPTLVEEPSSEWTAPAARISAPAKLPPDEGLESAPFVEPAPSTPAEEPAFDDASSAENADPAHATQ
ncbi:MAG: tetratricopeptide repeat protein [Planctomycetaceae bacterium]